MLGYLQKFNSLPSSLRQKISGSEAMAKIEALEKKYNILLAVLIMKIVVREIKIDDLLDYLIKENLPKDRAEELAQELKQKIFFSLGNYFSASEIKPERLIKPTMDAPVLSADESSVNEPKIKSASFFFSPDDEQEIRELTKKIVIAENSDLVTETVDDKLKKIISRVQINFGSADLADRFSQILRTYLRGIRNKFETNATLMKPFLSGGLSFDEDSAEKVMSFADKVLNSESDQSIKPLLKINLPKSEKADSSLGREISRDAAYDFSKLRKQDSKIKDDLKKLDTAHELAPLTPTVLPAQAGVSVPITQINAPIAKGKASVITKEVKTNPKPISPAVESDSFDMPLIKRRFKAENLNQSQKAKVEDVKYIPRVMGPLDEIKYMNLINFRRLDRSPSKSADKIKNKINLLEEDYAKKLEGIKFWRQSPIYRLYLEIGHLSISDNKPIDVIIEERKMANLDYLTADEFRAIMDLNKSLRF